MTVADSDGRPLLRTGTKWLPGGSDWAAPITAVQDDGEEERGWAIQSRCEGDCQTIRRIEFALSTQGSDEVFWAVGPSAALDECGGIAVSGGFAVNSSGEWPIGGALAFGTDAHVSVFGAEMQNLLPTQDITLEMCECSNGRLGL